VVTREQADAQGMTPLFGCVPTLSMARATQHPGRAGGTCRSPALPLSAPLPCHHCRLPSPTIRRCYSHYLPRALCFLPLRHAPPPYYTMPTPPTAAPNAHHHLHASPGGHAYLSTQRLTAFLGAFNTDVKMTWHSGTD